MPQDNQLNDVVATAASQTFKFYKMKTLSRDEMKKIIGGNAPYLYAGGSCNGSVGEWEMTPPTSTGSCYADIQRYCSSGSGSCTYIQ